jgi:hypothetical protein
MRKQSNIRPEYFLYAANRPSEKTIDLLGQQTIDRLRRILATEASPPDAPRTGDVQDSDDLD